MKDDFLTREWADNCNALNNEIDKLVRKIAKSIRETFEELHDIQFDAPWRHLSQRNTRISGKC